MISNLPQYISFIFGLTTVVTFILFIWIIKNSDVETTRKKTAYIGVGMIIWLSIQYLVSVNDIYNADTDSLPPKIVLFGILPIVFLFFILLASHKGRAFIDSLPLKQLTYLNLVRIPVEIVLFWLFLNKAVPELMTFEGRNFDIIAGISAPFVAYFGLTKKKISQNLILIWNFACLGLLLNIVVNAFLSAPSPIQKFAFEQPNIALLNFPFVWLPTFIVPVVLFCHLASIRQLLRK